MPQAKQRNPAFQVEVEAVLYGNGYAQQTGAVYRLLQRSGVVRDSLALKKACVQQGIVTQHEFDSMRAHLGDVRSFTLIPLAALRTALSVFGCDAKSEALVAALGIDRPDDWPESEAEAEEAEEAKGGADEEDEDGDGGAESAHEDGMDGDEGGDHGDSGGSDAVSIAGTEVVEEHTIVGDDDDATTRPSKKPSLYARPSQSLSGSEVVVAAIQHIFVVLPFTSLVVQLPATLFIVPAAAIIARVDVFTAIAVEVHSISRKHTVAA